MRVRTTVRMLAAAGAGVVIARRMTGSRSGADRWLAVTVYRPVEEVRERIPELLAELGDRVELRIQPAPGDKGTEVAARLPETGSDGLVARVTGTDPRQEVRAALRRAKSLLETGDVLQPDPPSTHPGPGGRLVRLVSRRAGGEGRL